MLCYVFLALELLLDSKHLSFDHGPRAALRTASTLLATNYVELSWDHFCCSNNTGSMVKPPSHFPLSCSILAGSVSPTFFLNSVLKIKRSCWPLGLCEAYDRSVAINIRAINVVSRKRGGSMPATYQVKQRGDTDYSLRRRTRRQGGRERRSWPGRLHPATGNQGRAQGIETESHTCTVATLSVTPFNTEYDFTELDRQRKA